MAAAFTRSGRPRSSSSSPQSRLSHCAAGGHDQQRLAPGLRELLEDAADGALLVVALDDGRFHLGDIERLAAAAPQDQAGEFVLFVKPGHPARRIGGVVPSPCLVAVGVENQRALAVHLLQAIGVELGLLLAHGRIGGRLLCFHRRQRLAVVAPQHIVHVADALVVGHTRHFIFPVAGLIQRPPGALQVHVDQVAAGLGF
jgi:hypothetical protein